MQIPNGFPRLYTILSDITAYSEVTHISQFIALDFMCMSMCVCVCAQQWSWSPSDREMKKMPCVLGMVGRRRVSTGTSDQYFKQPQEWQTKSMQRKWKSRNNSEKGKNIMASEGEKGRI